MALGASPARVRREVLRTAIAVIAIGAAGGALGAALMCQLLTKLLFEVRPIDPLAFAAAFTTITIFAAIAVLVPTRAATRIDPATALRGM